MILVTTALWPINSAIGPWDWRTPTAQAVLYSPLNNYRPKDHAVIRKDGVWHAYSIYVCIDQTPPCDTTPRGLMHLTSTDLKNWTEVGYVVPPGTAGAWDDYDTWAPSVVERNGTYYMFYTGVDQNGSGTLVQKIGIATSTDLNTWVKYGSNPVINCDDFTWAYWDETNNADGAACRDPYVFWDQGEHQWVMLLSGRTGAGTMVIALATSEDLLTWREYGTIPTTANGTAESAHYLEHSGTHYVVYTDNQTIDLKYVSSSTSLYTGYGAETVTSLEDNAFASESFKDLNGREYFSRVDGTTNTKLDFDEISWTGSPFTVQEPSYGTIGDAVWSDSDSDGVIDAGESGIDNVSVKLYLDDGDGLFDVGSDDLYATKTTGDDPNTIGTQHGYYQFTNVIPDTYWVHIDPTNYSSGGALSGQVATTTNTTASVTVTDNLAVATVDVGFIGMGTTWPLATGGNFTTNSEAVLSSGRAATAPTAGTPSWWNTNWQYRRQVTVTAGSEILTTTHTVDLSYDLATLVSAGKVQADFDDVRLVWWNGSANVEVDLDILDSNTERFKIQSQIAAAGSDNNYFLYYGNPDTTVRSTRLAGVYDYYASFNALNGTTYGTWQEVGDTLWEITGNKIRYNNTVAGNRFIRDTAKTVDLTNDYSIEVNMTINSGQIGGLFLSDTDVTFTEGAADGYWMNVDATNDRLQFFHNQFGQVGTNQSFAGIATATNYRVRFDHEYFSSGLCLLNGYLNETLAGSVSEVPCGQNIFHSDGSDNAHFGLNTFNGNASYNDYKGFQRHNGSSSVSSTETALNPTRNGTVQPLSSQAVAFDKLTAFRASSIDQGGATTYVLSNDAGSSWLYWNGSAWAASDSTSGQSSTAATINTNATSFPSGGRQLVWKALLTASSNQLPTLLQVGASTNLAPAVPTLTAPANGSLPGTLRPAFTFSTNDQDSDAVQYQLQTDTTNTFSSANLQTFTQPSSQIGWSGQDQGGGTTYSSGVTATFTPPTPLPNGTNYWRVRAVDPFGSGAYGQYSATFSFTVPGPLTLSNIAADATSISTESISWTSSNSGTSYVAYGPTGAYGEAVFSGANVTNHVMTLTGLLPATTYHYRIITVDSYGQTTASDDATFVTSFPSTPKILAMGYQNGSNGVVTIIGQALAGQTIRIFVDGRRIQSVTLKGTAGVLTKFVIPFSFKLFRPGTYKLTLTAVDAQGKQSTPTKPTNVTIGSNLERPPLLNRNSFYVVQRGDSMWGLAKQFLKKGSEFTRLVTANVRRFPTLRRVPSIILPGWWFNIPIAIL